MHTRAVELHFHALHGLDDGPATMDESLDLILRAAIDGTGTVIATPHVRMDFVTDVSDLGERARELQATAVAAGAPVEVRPGAELGADMVGRLSQAELELVAQGPPDSRWLLVEAPFDAIGADFHAATGELRDRGFGVLVAHPERSADAAMDRSAGLHRELASGSLAQVNAQSITGDHGPDAQDAAFRLIEGRLVSVVASDAHGATRPPLLGEARARLLERGLDPALCRDLTFGGPRRLLARGFGRSHALVA